MFVIHCFHVVNFIFKCKLLYVHYVNTPAELLNSFALVLQIFVCNLLPKKKKTYTQAPCGVQTANIKAIKKYLMC